MVEHREIKLINAAAVNRILCGHEDLREMIEHLTPIILRYSVGDTGDTMDVTLRFPAENEHAVNFEYMAGKRLNLSDIELSDTANELLMKGCNYEADRCRQADA